MSATRPHTKDYPEQDRKRLGLAVQRAREVNFAFRPAFAEHAKIGLTSLVKLETGKPVGAFVYEKVARALPGWTEDTPVAVLAGEKPPPTPKPAEQPAKVEPQDEPPYEWSAETRQKLIAMSLQEVMQLVEHTRLMRGDAEAERALRAITKLRSEADSIAERTDAP